MKFKLIDFLLFLILVIILIDFQTACSASPMNGKTKVDTALQSKWYKQAITKLKSGADALEKKRLALVKEYERLDYRIRSLEKEWLGVHMPLSVGKKYSALIKDRDKILDKISDIWDQSYGLLIQLGDECLRHGAADLAEAHYAQIMQDSEISDTVRMKVAGRLLPIYSNRARAWDGQQQYYLAEIEWQKIVDMLGKNHPKASEANSRLVFYAEQERKRQAAIATIRETLLAGLQIGDPISKADELYGKVFATGDQLYDLDPDYINYRPDRVYWFKEDKAWLLIWAFSQSKKITDILVTRKIKFDHEYNRDCGAQLVGLNTARGVTIGDSIHRAIALYGSHERPTGSTLWYTTGDQYDWALEGFNAGLLGFGYDEKSKLIHWIHVGMKSDAWSFYEIVPAVVENSR